MGTVAFFRKFIRKKVGAAVGWETLRVGAAAGRNVKEYGNVWEARFGGTCGVEVGLPARGHAYFTCKII